MFNINLDKIIINHLKSSWIDHNYLCYCRSCISNLKSPNNTARCIKAVSMLGQCRRRWPAIETTLVMHFLVMAESGSRGVKVEVSWCSIVHTVAASIGSLIRQVSSSTPPFLEPLIGRGCYPGPGWMTGARAGCDNPLIPTWPKSLWTALTFCARVRWISRGPLI